MQKLINDVNRIVLGIDPGSLNFGYCMLKQNGSNYTLLTRNILKLQKISDQIDKNRKIYDLLTELDDTYKIDEISVEQPVYGKDPQAMLKLGRVLGCCIGFAIAHKLPVIEYPPKNVKRVITGNGNAAKQQVAYMVSKILNIPFSEQSKYDDTDATAIALCHIFNISGTPVMSAKKSWSQFIKDNPGRVV